MPEEKLVRPAGPGAKLSYEVTPSPNTKHQSVSGNLHWLLRSYRLFRR